MPQNRFCKAESPNEGAIHFIVSPSPHWSIVSRTRSACSPQPAGTNVRGHGESTGQDLLRAAFAAFNDVVRTEGDVATFVRDYFHPGAEYRPVEDRDWFREASAITRSNRWIDTWAVGTYRIDSEEILEFDSDRYVVTFRTKGVGRGSGVPIEAVTSLACIWRDGRFTWFDEYSDKPGALAAIGERTEPQDRPGSRDEHSLAERLMKAGEAAFAAFVRRRSDHQLDRLFASDRALRTLFKRMEQVFGPARAGGFRGEVQYSLLCRDGVRTWTVLIDGGRAVARAGEAIVPAVTLNLQLPLFIRIAAGQIHPAKACRNGWLEVRGDFETAARIGVMFGLSR
jgi:SCP-2 sterol transfer family